MIQIFTKRRPIHRVKTAKELLKEFDEKYLVSEIDESIELAVLRDHLAKAAAINGSPDFRPSFPFSELLRRYLNYTTERRMK